MINPSRTGLTDFGFLFPDLQENPDTLLPRSHGTVKALDQLGRYMQESGPGNGLNSTIPAAYTYFGQFVSHDVNLERSDEIADISSPQLEPLLLQQVLLEIRNSRSAALDLDSVYNHPALRYSEGPQQDGRLPRIKLRLGEVSFSQELELQDRYHDFFRQGRLREKPEHDREALIGDPRNDENLIVAQLHVAFLRAHNALVDQGLSFEEARTLLRQHYQWIVVHDFLPRIADTRIVKETLAGNRLYQPWCKPFFLPLEFTVAAFRFGHSMVRREYRYNATFQQATLQDLFTLTALSGNLDPASQRNVPPGGFDNLPDNWVIDWRGFFDARQNPSRRIDTVLVEPLLHLRDSTGQIRSVEPRLAVRNLRRGYLLRMPTGQAVAQRIGIEPMPTEMIGNPAQRAVLAKAGMEERTPLWFYILAEAHHLGEGNRLGPVGSTLVAEVLIGLVRSSADSILAGGGRWRPSLGREGRFELPDLLRLAGVLPP
jgi:hypothetical protein